MKIVINKEELIEHVVDLLKERLPGVRTLVGDMFNLDAKAVFHNLQWGAAEPNLKIQIEDQIRKRLNTLLEPTLNEIKKDVANRMMFKGVWKEIDNTITQILVEPSKAKQALKKLHMELVDTGQTYLVVVLLLVLVGWIPAVYLLFKIFVINYFRDITFIIYTTLKKQR